MIYRARTSKAVSAWIADRRGAWSGGAGFQPARAGCDPAPHCPGFFLYRGFTGCPAWAEGQPCSYCYLRTTFRTDPELREGVCWVTDIGDCDQCDRLDQHDRLGTCESPDCPPDISSARAAVEKWLAAEPLRECRHDGEWDIIPFVLNAGELADSLAFPPEENPHIARLLDLFSDPATNPHGHKLLLLTKAGLQATQAHLGCHPERSEGPRVPSPNIILSWSVGTESDAERYWDPQLDRLRAAVVAARAAWRVRLRLDPLSYIGPWFVYNLANQVARLSASSAQSTDGRFPELITLGTLRHRGGRPKLPAPERASIYRAALEGLRAGGYEGEIGLCKETPAMIRDVLGIEPESMRCNCVP